ncbi:hypothetical protein APR04_002401 [Promicromonospora umidemergens]|uniref:LytR cell envelope-related transcriptional attenuator n=1 Tax=Promicromonospora umidemergens TaxID=629679 RepID=A0ABP8WSX3_9MICO|nr:hypothetical protein [Promicromonospora umidemergens]MCP2283493.1 hypothetical protein [Promicromonospora umidemergens]
MTKSGYPYPPDEFDVAVPGGAPVGVHRAPRSGWSSAWPFLLVAVVCAAVAWGGITLLSGGDDPAEAQGGASTSASPSTSASADPSGDASAEASGEPSVEPSDETPQQSAEDLVAAADPAAAYMVFNRGTVGGLASTTSESLVSSGLGGATFSQEADPESAPDLSAVDTSAANTIWYGDGREKEGMAAAALLGIPEANVVMNEAVSGSPEAVWLFMYTEPTG